MICKKCGNELSENEKFCGACGTPYVMEVPAKKKKSGAKKLLIFFSILLIIILAAAFIPTFLDYNKVDGKFYLVNVEGEYTFQNGYTMDDYYVIINKFNNGTEGVEKYSWRQYPENKFTIEPVLEIKGTEGKLWTSSLDGHKAYFDKSSHTIKITLESGTTLTYKKKFFNMK